jgi:hypothetical protein
MPQATARSITPAPKLPSVKIPKSAKLPDDPNLYAMLVRGDCLNPVVRDGDHVIVSPATPAKGGQIVHIRRTDGMHTIKRLINALPPVLGRALPKGSEIAYLVGCEMLKPPKRFFLEASKVEFARAVVGLIRKGKFIALNGRAQ